MAQSGYGRIRMKFDFLGAEIPVEGTGAYAGTGTAGYKLGEFKVTGDLAEGDTGVISLAKTNGWGRISGNNENGKGLAVGTEVIFSPTLNGPLALETRVETQTLTTKVLFLGFCAANADDVAEPITGSSTTLTLDGTNFASGAGFFFDSQLDDAADWHMAYNGGTITGETDSTAIDADEDATASESQNFRVEIDRNGTVRWYIDNELKQTKAGAVSTTTLLTAMVACWATEGTLADLDVDYIAVEAERDWTV